MKNLRLKTIILSIVLLCLNVSAVWGEEARTMKLYPAPDSEILDYVTIITLPDEHGQIVEFQATFNEGENGGYEIKVNPETGTYKAIKEEISAEIIQEMEKNYLKSEVEDQAIITQGKPAPPVKYYRAATGYIETQCPLNIPLCRTYTNLKWQPQDRSVGGSDTYTWAGCPTDAGTCWYAKRSRNYLITVDENFANAHGWAYFKNDDFAFRKLQTRAYHDVYVHGWWVPDPGTTCTVSVNGSAQYQGEGAILLHTHVYFFWGL